MTDEEKCPICNSGMISTGFFRFYCRNEKCVFFTKEVDTVVLKMIRAYTEVARKEGAKDERERIVNADLSKLQDRLIEKGINADLETIVGVLREIRDGKI